MFLTTLGTTPSSKVCHTLPYTCSLVHTTVGQEEGSLRILHGDALTQPRGLYSPTPLAEDPVESPQLAPLPPALYRDPSMSNGTKPLSWILTPKRGHSALFSGIKSLSDRRKVILVAGALDVREGSGEQIDSANLSDKLKGSLERGLKDLSEDAEKGIVCAPVWMDDTLATNFYEGFCKGCVTLVRFSLLPAWRELRESACSLGIRPPLAICGPFSIIRFARPTELALCPTIG